MAMAYLWPYADVPIEVTQSPVLSGTVTDTKEPCPGLDQFEALWALNLQQPLYGASVPVTPTTPAKQPMPLSVRLAGTVVEPGHSVAIFVSGGKIILKGVGDQIDQAEVLTITAHGVSLRHRGKEVDLNMRIENKH